MAPSRRYGSPVIAKGVETSGERDALVSEGCDLLQGYLFGKPGVGFDTPTFGLRDRPPVKDPSIKTGNSAVELGASPNPCGAPLDRLTSF